MAWLKLEDTAREHPKVHKLARRLGIKPVVALGHMAALWAWTLRMAPDGDLSDLDAEDIEIGAMWDGEPGAFVAAASEVHLLDTEDKKSKVHDWMDRAGSYKEARSRQFRRKKTEDKV